MRYVSSRSFWFWSVLLAAVVATLAGSAPPAHAVSGSATIEAKELLKLRGCGREKGTTSVQLLLRDDGRWSLTSSALMVGGTYVASGRGDRKLTLTVDDDAALRTYLEERLTTQCGEAVAGVTLEPKKLRAKLNRPGTQVKLQFLHRIVSPERGKHRVGGKGTLGPLPSTTTSSSTSTVTSSTTSSTTTTAVPPCENGVQDGDETDVDCGGGTCSGCADGEGCALGSDCLSRFCDNGSCVDPCPTQPAGTPCADDGNACTVDECDGSTCQHTPAGSGTVCRDAAGPCDVAETCDGTAAPCPADQLLSGNECRPSDGECDVAEVCDGVSAGCPADVFTSAGTTCRESVDDCDAVEECTGASADCPDDGLLGAETVCRAASDDCDAEEVCTGRSVLCPDDFVKQADTLCRESTGAGDPAELCDGMNAACPPDVTSTTTTSTTTASTTTTAIVSGCFVDQGDGTIRDTCTTLQWEMKENASGLHDVGGRYSWAGCCGGDCSTSANLCQPDAAAAATCAAEAPAGVPGCSVCAAGTCDVDPNGLGASTTVFDWVNQVNASSYAGYDDWRLAVDFGPGDLRDELRGILLEQFPSDCPSPCIDPIFGPTDEWAYWTSTGTAVGTAWYVIFEGGAGNAGFTGTTSMQSAFAVRAVRESECIRDLCQVGDCGLIDDGCGGMRDCGEARTFCFADECGMAFSNCGGFIECGGCFGEPCDELTPCAFELVCGSEGTCGSRLGGPCSSDAECGEGECLCTSGLEICDENGCVCDSAGGECVANLDRPCTGSGDCAEGLVCSPTTSTCKKDLGESCSPVCPFDGSIEYPAPLECAVWTDAACASGSCFKNALDPANATQVGTPQCCVGLDEQCQDDTDCCKGNYGFGGGLDFRPRHCVDDLGSGTKRCKRLSLTGEECEIRDDCLDPADECTNDVCTSASIIQLRKGDVCTPGDTQRVCDVDPDTGQQLSCTDCNPENQGFRCIPQVVADSGCCNNGRVDQQFCGSWPAKCCDWECTNVTTDAENCSDCGASCDLLLTDPWVAACNSPPTCSPDFNGGGSTAALSACQLGGKCGGGGQGQVFEVCVPEGEYGCLDGGEDDVCCIAAATPQFFDDAVTTGSYENLTIATGCFTDDGCDEGFECVRECGRDKSGALYDRSCEAQGVCLPE